MLTIRTHHPACELRYQVDSASFKTFIAVFTDKLEFEQLLSHCFQISLGSTFVETDADVRKNVIVAPRGKRVPSGLRNQVLRNPYRRRSKVVRKVSRSAVF